jgi:hypothetical protein
VGNALVATNIKEAKETKDLELDPVIKAEKTAAPEGQPITLSAESETPDGEPVKKLIEDIDPDWDPVSQSHKGSIEYQNYYAFRTGTASILAGGDQEQDTDGDGVVDSQDAAPDDYGSSGDGDDDYTTISDFLIDQFGSLYENDYDYTSDLNNMNGTQGTRAKDWIAEQAGMGDAKAQSLMDNFNETLTAKEAAIANARANPNDPSSFVTLENAQAKQLAAFAEMQRYHAEQTGDAEELRRAENMAERAAAKIAQTEALQKQLDAAATPEEKQAIMDDYIKTSREAEDSNPNKRSWEGRTQGGVDDRYAAFQKGDLSSYQSRWGNEKMEAKSPYNYWDNWWDMDSSYPNSCSASDWYMDDGGITGAPNMSSQFAYAASPTSQPISLQAPQNNGPATVNPNLTYKA